MSEKRLAMRKIREILRLRFEHRLSLEKIAVSCGIGRTTVHDQLCRFQLCGLSWPLPQDMDDIQLEQQLYPRQRPCGTHDREIPDWGDIYKGLQKKGVTLMLLWQEYKERHPDGLQYSQFCQRYQQWKAQIEPVMRGAYRAGESMFVDYAGMTVPVFDPLNRNIRDAQVFVAVLGASNYTYAEASWSQGLYDWIGSHVRAFEYFGGVPQMVVPDNLKSGVKSPCYYDPVINPTYLDMARHYGTAIIPTRVYKPRDKAKVETGVQISERWILARLRNQTFFDLNRLNETIRFLLEDLNQRPFQKLEGCRKSAFETIDRPALKPLPDCPYSYASWKRTMVPNDYHIEVDGHHYSVPCSLIRKTIDIRISESTIECFYQNQRVAVHRRSQKKGEKTTITDHMPPSHRYWAQCNEEQLIEEAKAIGEQTLRLFRTILSSASHPQLGYKSCSGLIRLGKSYGPKRLEAACAKANQIGTTSYRSIESILKRNLDQTELWKPTSVPHTNIIHENLRGGSYYH